jgi:hypothetical protein
MEFLQANWFWILLGVGAVWFLFRRGGMGCGMGGHGSHESRTSRETRDTPPAHGSHDGHPAEESPAREVETVPPRRHRGC